MQKCHDDHLAGKLNFEGCAILDKVYKSVKPIAEMYLKVGCTGKIIRQSLSLSLAILTK